MPAGVLWNDKLLIEVVLLSKEFTGLWIYACSFLIILLGLTLILTGGLLLIAADIWLLISKLPLKLFGLNDGGDTFVSFLWLAKAEYVWNILL